MSVSETSIRAFSLHSVKRQGFSSSLAPTQSFAITTRRIASKGFLPPFSYEKLLIRSSHGSEDEFDVIKGSWVKRESGFQLPETVSSSSSSSSLARLPRRPNGLEDVLVEHEPGEDVHNNPEDRSALIEEWQDPSPPIYLLPPFPPCAESSAPGRSHREGRSNIVVTTTCNSLILKPEDASLQPVSYPLPPEMWCVTSIAAPPAIVRSSRQRGSNLGMDVQPHFPNFLVLGSSTGSLCVFGL